MKSESTSYIDPRNAMLESESLGVSISYIEYGTALVLLIHFVG
jgi:hypothetical protein